MALYSSWLIVVVTVALLNPVLASENETDASASGIVVNGSNSLSERLEFAAVDFCYRGIVVDAETGEVTELYTPCSEDVIEGNLDLA